MSDSTPPKQTLTSAKRISLAKSSAIPGKNGFTPSPPLKRNTASVDTSDIDDEKHHLNLQQENKELRAVLAERELKIHDLESNLNALQLEWNAFGGITEVSEKLASKDALIEQLTTDILELHNKNSTLVRRVEELSPLEIELEQSTALVATLMHELDEFQAKDILDRREKLESEELVECMKTELFQVKDEALRLQARVSELERPMTEDTELEVEKFLAVIAAMPLRWQENTLNPMHSPDACSELVASIVPHDERSDHSSNIEDERIESIRSSSPISGGDEDVSSEGSDDTVIISHLQDTTQTEFMEHTVPVLESVIVSDESQTDDWSEFIDAEVDKRLTAKVDERCDPLKAELAQAHEELANSQDLVAFLELTIKGKDNEMQTLLHSLIDAKLQLAQRDADVDEARKEARTLTEILNLYRQKESRAEKPANKKKGFWF